MLKRVPADMWVASEGATDFMQAGSILPGSVGTQLGFLPEVETVSPLLVRPVEVTKVGDGPDDKFDIQLVGYDQAINLGGPLRIAAGKSPPGPGEIVIDEATSDRFGVDKGDKLTHGRGEPASSGITVVALASP